MRGKIFLRNLMENNVKVFMLWEVKLKNIEFDKEKLEKVRILNLKKYN
jgi:hypothetical protein